MQYMATSGTLMQVIYILRYNIDMKIFFQFCQKIMRLIGFYGKKLLTTKIVKFMYKIWIFPKSFRGSYFHYIMTLPQSIFIPKSFNSTFGTDEIGRASCRERG